MILMASWVHRNGPVRLAATTRVHSLNGRSSSGTAGAPPPALLNRKSRRPNSALVLANSALTLSTSPTSVGTARHLALVALASSTVFSSASLRRPASATDQPAFMSASAEARPMPLPAPVTIAT